VIDRSGDQERECRSGACSHGAEQPAFRDELPSNVSAQYAECSAGTYLVVRSITFIVMVLTTAKSTMIPITSE